MTADHDDLDVAYDDLPTRESKAERRALWDRQLTENLSKLNLADEFEAQGRSYVEQIDGKIVIPNA